MGKQEIQRRTITTLMLSSTLGWAANVSVAAVVGLLASEMVGNDLWAGLPSAASTLGAALAATPLAMRAQRRGRRPSILVGYLIGVVGAGMGIVAGQGGLFWMLVTAMLLFGMGQAANLQSRYAAADLADEDHRARAIALVVWVGTIGAVLGPVAALWANRIGVDLGVADWVSPLLLGAGLFALSGLVVSRRLRPDPLEIAGGVNRSAPFENPLRGVRETWRVLWPNRPARLALMTMAVSQMAMVAVMTMTPLHMRDHAHADLSTLVISAHVLGMFGLSPLVGRWADRFGRVRMLGVGAGILGLGTVSAVAGGYALPMMFIGLFLLGVGWSFALIGGSALLTESLPVGARVGAQGLSDLAMSTLGAAAAFGSGFVKELAGYHWLANLATLAAILMMVSVAGLVRRKTALAGRA
ncbi:MAG TPA: MFS transporter [Acidimicrobiia bacterium]|nr:MFS transporter [Acidimicrobiia bacterium]